MLIVFKIFLWFLMPAAYFLFMAVSFVGFRNSGDINAFQSLNILNNQIFYWAAFGGWIFSYIMKKVIALIMNKGLRPDLTHEYSIILSVSLLGMTCVSVLWKCIFLMI